MTSQFEMSQFGALLAALSAARRCAIDDLTSNGQPYSLYEALEQHGDTPAEVHDRIDRIALVIVQAYQAALMSEDEQPAAMQACVINIDAPNA